MKSGQKFLMTHLLYLKVFVAFAFGIILADNFPLQWWLLLAPPILFFTLIVGYRLSKISRSKIADSLMFSLIFASGIAIHSTSYYIQDQNIVWLKPIMDIEARHRIRIEEKPIAKSNSLQIEASLLSSYADSFFQNENNRILLYLPKEIHLQAPFYGQILEVKGRLIEPPQAHYPFEFDYAQWLRRREISATLYSKDISLIGYDNSRFYQFLKLPLLLRDYFELEIDKAVENLNSRSIAKSILIGVRTDIDRDLYTAYADTGTIHILSISGLHFGILILFLDYLLSLFIPRESIRLPIKHSISFIYALLTGFSAPIMRSFIMFLFFDIVKWKQLRISSYNILFLSAWLILLYDTHQLFHLGFQFSYAALLGIMLIYQRAIWKVELEHRVALFLWQSIVTLLAAWLFTAPLTIFYYHKFSWLGSLSNILVVPLTTLIMYVGFIFMLFSKVVILSKYIALALSFLIEIQNNIISFFSQLPYSSISSNALDVWGLILTYLAIAALICLLYSKSIWSLRFLLASISVLIFHSSWYQYRLHNTTDWFLVSNYKHSAIAYKSKGDIHVFTDSLDDNMQLFFVANLTSYYGARPPILHDSKNYVSQRENKYGYHLDASPQYLLLAKENKEYWYDYIAKRDSFVLMGNVGYQKSKLIEKLQTEKKHYYVH